MIGPDSDNQHGFNEAAGRSQAAPDDPHSPTAAGPNPEGGPLVPAAAEPADAAAQAPIPEPPAADPPTQPTPTVDSAQASYAQPAGSALLGDGTGAVDPHPEKAVGAAFAGGLVAALFLKGLARRKHS